LQDEDVGVRWAAREALIALGGSGVEPLLRDLIQASDSIWLREGAQHILSALKDQGCLAAPLMEVLNALDRSEPEVRLPSTAASAWEALFGSP
jgi:HEAT repeat protein